jgi:hypothetical protein
MTTYTLIHVAISLVAILSGLVVLFGLIAARSLNGWTAFFLATTVATSATGFGFPFERLLPSHIFGVISLVVLAVAIFARYARNLAGAWRKTYVITAMFALYLNVFVLVFQAFLKVPALKELAPTQTETPFKVAQLFVLISFISLTTAAAIRFRGEPMLPSEVGSLKSPGTT